MDVRQDSNTHASDEYTDGSGDEPAGIIRRFTAGAVVRRAAGESGRPHGAGTHPA